MAREKAEVEVSLQGTGTAVNNAKRIDDALGTMGKKAETYAKRASSGLLSIASAAAKATTGVRNLSIEGAINSAREMDDITSKLSRSSGRSSSELHSLFEGLEKRTLTSAEGMSAFSLAINRVTYDSNFGIGSLQAFSDAAQSAGRDLGDELPVALAIQKLGVDASDAEREIGRLADIANKTKTIGGPVALRDTIATLSPILDSVSTATDESRVRLEALVAVLGKGLKPPQAREVAGAAIGLVSNRALDIERLTGNRVIDDNGAIIDPIKALAQIQKLGRSKFSGSKETERRALIAEFQARLGTALRRTNFAEAERLAREAKNTGEIANAATNYRNSKPGSRRNNQIHIEGALRALGSKALSIGDTIATGKVDKNGYRHPGLLTPFTMTDKEYWENERKLKTEEQDKPMITGYSLPWGSSGSSGLASDAANELAPRPNSGGEVYQELGGALDDLAKAQRENTETIKTIPGRLADAINERNLRMKSQTSPNGGRDQ